MCTNRQKIHTRTLLEAKEAFKKVSENYALYEHTKTSKSATLLAEAETAHVTLTKPSRIAGINNFRIPEPKSIDGSYVIGRDI